MATTFETPPVVPFSAAFGALPTEFLEASTRAISASAELYTEVLTSQAEATRAVFEAYAGVGTQAVQAGAETTERAEQAATRVTRGTGAAAKRATRRTGAATRRAAAKAKPKAEAQAQRRAAAVEAPIAGYDDLSADDVVSKLPEQPQKALAQIAAYEQAHEKRATVLQRVAALTGPEPAPGYDELTADEAAKLVTGGNAALAAAVRDYERRHKDRSSVIEAATRNADADAS